MSTSPDKTAIQPFPASIPELLDALEHTFPPAVLQPDSMIGNMQDVYIAGTKAGAHSVVHYLKTWHTEAPNTHG